MDTQEVINFKRISAAIDYIKTNFAEQPSLDLIAEKVNLSPFHFQRLFTDWAGTSPKNFLQYISLNHAKNLLQKPQANLFNTADEIGFSSSSRLHDLFVKIEGMSPAEYKNGGKNLTINYSFVPTIFGNVLIASTNKGICYLAFYDKQDEAFNMLQSIFPNAHYFLTTDALQENALLIFKNELSDIKNIKLHLKSTPFQLKVWEALLQIPLGQLSSYGKMAEKINHPKASRAVGTAIGSNPIAYIIPCHRVIQTSGNIGGYMWGNTRKTAIIAWESAQIE
jgi:AraC family transcriptional regulator of adaptative response/methylated-DNA-[protein]-cysteine methyltransferase